jgi:hypothetical protein
MIYPMKSNPRDRTDYILCCGASLLSFGNISQRLVFAGVE